MPSTASAYWLPLARHVSAKYEFCTGSKALGFAPDRRRSCRARVTIPERRRLRQADRRAARVVERGLITSASDAVAECDRPVARASPTWFHGPLAESRQVAVTTNPEAGEPTC